MPDFTKQQVSAIEYRRLDACVVAGPGSGKTTVLVERYRALIKDHGFDPCNILAITFTASLNGYVPTGKSVAQLRPFENPWPNPDPRAMPATLHRHVAHSPTRLPAARPRQRADLLAWAARLASSTPGSLKDFVLLIK